MSVVGTGIAASVAQTSLQAQQVARRRDQRERETSDTRRIDEIIQARMLALEEGDSSASATAPHIDQQLPQQQQQPQQPVTHHHTDVPASPPEGTDPQPPHLDVKG